MDSELIYWIWLQSCLGVNNRRLKSSMNLFEDAGAMYRASERDFRLCGIFTDTEIKKLSDKSLSKCEKAIRYCEQNRIGICHYKSEEYPTRLAEIFSPPIVLYYIGTMPDQDKLHCGIVGTRYPEEGYRSIAYNLAYDLAKHDCIVVSGGAIGTDVCAHSGAVDAYGITICVIACGFDQYSSSNEELIMERIPEKGAVVTEYPPGIPAALYNFPMRNRIITGLSHCNVVVQAGAGSGSLIAAKCSIAQGRKLFAVPGSVDSERFVGSNTLLKFGCSAVLNYRDVLHWNQQRIIFPDMSGNENPEFDSQMKEEITGKFDQLQKNWFDSKRKHKPPSGYVLTSEIDEQCRPLKSEDELYSFEEGEHERPEKVEITFGRSEGEFSDPADPESRKGILHEAILMGDYTEYKDMSLQKRIVICLKNKFGISDESLNMDINDIMCTEEYREYLALQRAYDILGWQSKAVNIDMTKNDSAVSGKVTYEDEVQPVEDEKIDKNTDEESEKISDNTGKSMDSAKEQLTENAYSVYDTISDEPVNVNIIKIKTGLSMPEILTALTELQFCGLVECLPGRRYIRS